ncbi:MAG: S8 family serine peptidase [Paludibacteraceae bacterium]|nr:S8 family serine peptidase [Paludibacteraceae bacterium]
MKRFISISIIIIAGFLAGAKNPAMYFIYLSDKADNGYDLAHPEMFLSQRALDRRARLGIQVDSTDMPVTKAYINQVTATGAQLFHSSRWMNGLLIWADNEQINVVKNLNCVDSVDMIRPSSAGKFNIKSKVKKEKTNDSETSQWDDQNRQINVQKLHQTGFRGQGILTAVIDCGYIGVDQTSGFDSLRRRNGITDTYDFIRKSNNVYDYHSHGTSVLSTMAYIVPNEFTGSAPDADYCLYITENNNEEYLYESDLWILAAERADSIGADVITSSLGYFYTDDEDPRFVYANMNGTFFRASLAAQMSSQKGILTLIAAGNEGNNDWRYIGTPADAKDILTVGGVDMYDEHSSFSSYGPSADGRIKPDICARATQTTVSDCYSGELKASNGTSFATPVAAGMVTSLLSALPNIDTETLRNVICSTASQCDKPNDSLGYGIPDAWKVYSMLKDVQETDETTAESDIKAWFEGNVLRISGYGGMYELIDCGGKVVLRGIGDAGLDDMQSGIYFLKCGNKVVKLVHK